MSVDNALRSTATTAPTILATTVESHLPIIKEGESANFQGLVGLGAVAVSLEPPKSPKDLAVDGLKKIYSEVCNGNGTVNEQQRNQINACRQEVFKYDPDYKNNCELFAAFNNESEKTTSMFYRVKDRLMTYERDVFGVSADIQNSGNLYYKTLYQGERPRF
jgi:hypothetical protein